MSEVPKEFSAEVIRLVAKHWGKARIIVMLVSPRRVNCIYSNGSILVEAQSFTVTVADKTPKSLAAAIGTKLVDLGLLDLLAEPRRDPLRVIVGLVRNMRLEHNNFTFFCGVAEER